MSAPLRNPYGLVSPPLIPSSANFQSLQVETSKIESIVGDVLSELSTWKGSVRTATTTNIVPIGEQTIDGVPLVTGNTILVKTKLPLVKMDLRS